MRIKTFEFILAGIILGLLIGLWSSLNQLNNNLDKLTPKLETVEEVYKQAKPIQNHIKKTNAKADSKAISYMIIYLSRKYGVNANQITAQAEVESGFNIKAVGLIGERGLLQVRQSTFREHGAGDIANWRDSLECGVKYMAWLKHHYGESIVSYNAGPNRRNKHIISRGYRGKVLRNINELEGVEG